MDDLNEFSDALVESVRKCVERATSPLLTKIADLEQRLAQIPEPRIGEKGIDGANGDVGPQGPAGEPGPQGPAGESIQGLKGEVGERGEKGLDGAPGPQGLIGESIAGPQGPVGEKGIAGADGGQGPQGYVGPQGEKGIDGHDGKSVYDLARAAGFAGTEMQWIASLRGADGPIGEKGTDGRDGRDGIGIRGESGPQGERGDPGKDGIEIKFLDGIDTARSYPAGTYACHDGAFIRAMRTTGPVTDGLSAAGWKVITDGEANFKIVQHDDLRTFTFVRTMASGRKFEESVTLPVPLDRGVWREGKYAAGDGVTRDGSWWLAQCATESQPGDSKHWRLAVRKGNNGRDGKDGEKGVPGRDLTGGNGLRR